MPDIVAGSVAVELVPSVRSFATRARAQLLPDADRLGAQIGDLMGAAAAKRIGSRIGGALRSVPARTQGAKAGDEYGGEFGRIVHARLDVALRSLPKAQIDANSTDVDRKLERIRVQMAALRDKRIGIDLSDEEAKRRLRLFESLLEKIRAEHPTVSIDVNAAKAIAELRAVRAEVNRVRAAGDSGGGGGTGTGGGTGGGGGFIQGLGQAALFALPPLTTLAGVAAGALGGIATAATAAVGGLGAFALVAKEDMKGVVTATQSVTKAQDALTHAVTPAQRVAALQKQRAAWQGLAPAEAQAVHGLLNFDQRWQQFAGRFKPLVFANMAGGLRVVSRLLPQLGLATAGAGAALLGLEHAASRALGSPYWQRFFHVIGAEVNPVITGLGHVLGNLAHGFAGLIEAFVPVERQMVAGLQRITAKFAAFGANAGRSSGFQQFISFVQSSGPVVVSTLGNLGRAVIEIARALAPLGSIELAAFGGLSVAVRVLARLNPALLQGVAVMYQLNRVMRLIHGQGLANIFSMFAAQAAADFRIARQAGMGFFASVRAGSAGAMAALDGLRIAEAGVTLGLSIAIPTLLSFFDRGGQHAQEFKSKVDQLSASLNQNTGAITKDTTAQIAHDLVVSGAITSAAKMGINAGLLTRAILGQRDAVAQVNAILSGYAGASSRAATQAGSLFHGVHDATVGTQQQTVASIHAVDVARQHSAAVQHLRGIIGTYTSELGAAQSQTRAAAREQARLTAALANTGGAARGARPPMLLFSRGLSGVSTSGYAASSALNSLFTAIDRILGRKQSLGSQLDQYTLALQSFASQVKNSSGALTGNSAAAATNREAIRALIKQATDIASTAAHQAHSVDAGTQAYQRQIGRLRDLAIRYGVSRAEFNRFVAANQVGTGKMDRLWQNFVDGQKAQAGKVVANTHGLVGSVNNQLNMLTGKALQAGRGTSGKLGTGIGQNAGHATGAAHTMVSGVESRFAGLYGQAQHAGQQTSKGLSDGIIAAEGQAEQAALQVAARVIGAVKNALGIASPSRVMIGIAQNIIQGLVQGLTGGFSTVESTSRELVKRLTAAYITRKDAQGKSYKDYLFSDQFIAHAKQQVSQLEDLARRHDTVGARLQAARSQLQNLTQARASEQQTVTDAATQDAALSNLIPQGQRVSAGAIRRGLAEQLAKLQRFDQELHRLGARGLNRDLLQQIFEMGPDAGIPYAQALLRSSALGYISNLERRIDRTASSLGSYAGHQLYDQGISAAHGLVAGLRSQEHTLARQMRRLADIMVGEIKRHLKIHSPSAVFYEFGQQTGYGLDAGIRSTHGRIRRSVNDLVAIPAPALGSRTAATARAAEYHLHMDDTTRAWEPRARQLFHTMQAQEALRERPDRPR